MPVTFLLACSGIDGFEDLRHGEYGSIPYAAEHRDTIWPDEEEVLVRPAPGHPLGSGEVLVLAPCDFAGPVLLDAVETSLSWTVVEEYDSSCLLAAPSPGPGTLTLGGRSGRIVDGPASTVVHLSDLHQQGCEPDERVVQILAAADAEGADLMLISGDLVDKGPKACQWEALSAALVGLQTPLLVVPGNHDYEHGGGEYEDPHAGLQLFMRTFHPLLAPRLELEGLSVLGIDTGTSTSGSSWTRLKLITTRGVTPEQVAEVESWAGATSPRILVGHAPFRTSALGMGESGHSERSGAMEESSGLEEVLAASAVLALFGHTHVNESWVAVGDHFERLELTQPTEGRTELEPLDGTWMLTTQSATNPWPRDGTRDERGQGHGYRVLERREDTWWSRSVRFTE